MNPADVSDQDPFESWLTDMNDAMERLKVLEPPALAARMDLSAESLPLIEQWVLQTYEATADMQAASQAQRVDAVARYVGDCSAGVWADAGLSSARTARTPTTGCPSCATWPASVPPSVR